MNNSIPKTSGIYKITCTANGKIYIGSSNNLHLRWLGHKAALRRQDHRNEYLQRAWNKYGEQCFVFETVELISRTMLLEREQYWLDLLMPFRRDIGYNISIKASAPTHTPEVAQKISRNRSGIKPSEATKELWRKIRKGKPSPNKGKRFSPEHCANIGKSKRGNSFNKGRKHTPEHRAKNADAKSKNYIVISPDGVEYTIRNMAAFCREHGLNKGRMIQVAHGKQKLHKGWFCKPND